MEYSEYEEKFKPTFEPDKLRELVDKWDDEDVEHEYTEDEIMEIARLEGRRRIEIKKDAERLLKEIEEHNRKYKDNVDLPKWIQQ